MYGFLPIKIIKILSSCISKKSYIPMFIIISWLLISVKLEIQKKLGKMVIGIIKLASYNRT